MEATTDSRETVDLEWMPNATSVTDQDISPGIVKKKSTDATAAMVQDISPGIVTNQQTKALATTVANQDILRGIAHLPGSLVPAVAVAAVATSPTSPATSVMSLDTWLETARPMTSSATTAINQDT